MTYDEFKDRLLIAGISVRALAKLLHMRPNSITNYRAKREVPRHLAVIATLLATVRAHDIDLADVFREG